MGNFLEVIYDLLLHPRAGMRAVLETQTLGRSFLVVFVCTLLCMLSLLGGGAQVLLALLFACEAALNWALFAAVWHLIAALFGADGQVRQFLKATGFVHILQVLFVPILFLVSVSPDGFSWLGALAVLGLAGWAFYLLVIALCEVYDVGSGKAVLILLAPLFVATVLLFVAFLSAGSYIFMFLQQGEALMQAPIF